jgi:nucleoside 2-deoxyribosyltransferase
MTVKVSTKTVFLSYSHGDPAFAAEVRNCLAEEGWQVRGVPEESPDANISAGQIREAIKESDVVVVLATPAWVRSSWGVFEAGVAYVQQKPIFVVTKDLPDDALPVHLQAFQKVSGKQLPKLVRGLRQLHLEE